VIVIHRRVAVGVVIAAACSLLGACGFQSPDVQSTEKSDVQGANLSELPVLIRNASITEVGTGISPPLYLYVTFVNKSPVADTLLHATSPDATLTLGGGTGLLGRTLQLPSQVPVQIVNPELGVSGATMRVAANPSPPVGTFLPVQFSFANGGTSVPIDVPIVHPGATTEVVQPVPTETASIPPQQGEPASD
jgi:hypothetical protein